MTRKGSQVRVLYGPPGNVLFRSRWTEQFQVVLLDAAASLRFRGCLLQPAPQQTGELFSGTHERFAVPGSARENGRSLESAQDQRRESQRLFLAGNTCLAQGDGDRVLPIGEHT